jgi:tRNA modification GTPase
MIHAIDDTIAAIATPIGEGAISIIRISGFKAISCVSKMFKGKSGLTKAKSHTLKIGKLQDNLGHTLDEVVCLIYMAPHSYTGEDVVEICCHGGMHVTKKVFENILSDEIRPAKPGEFTLRAFLNGKMDLSQAEAVADIIHAQSEKGYKTSIQQLEGGLSVKLGLLREQLMKATGLLELELDFAEDGIELINKESIRNHIKNCIYEIENLLRSYFYGKAWKEGVSVVLVGTPNAGKSSLMNAILKEERAIVTDIPGTTRDFIEEKYIHDGVLYRLIDTAGLRATEHPIEIEGIRRTWEIILHSDVIVFVHDCTKEISEEESKLIGEIKEKTASATPLIIANNKSDLVLESNRNIILGRIVTSAKNFGGIELLVKEISSSIFKDTNLEGNESITITNQRHCSALEKAKVQLSSALLSIDLNKSEEFIALDLRSAIDSMGEIIGTVTTEDILNEIFSKFCIGK